MTDDPHHSLKPVVNAIAGFFLGIAAIALPLVAVSDIRVKSPYKGLQPEKDGNTTQADYKRTIPAVDACRDLFVSGGRIPTRSC